MVVVELGEGEGWVVPPAVVVADGEGTAVESLGIQLAFPFDCLLTFLTAFPCLTVLIDRWPVSARGALATIEARELRAPCEMGLPERVELEEMGAWRKG